MIEHALGPGIVLSVRTGERRAGAATIARFLWHEVTKVAPYYPSVDALTQPMQVREGEPPPWGKG